MGWCTVLPLFDSGRVLWLRLDWDRSQCHLASGKIEFGDYTAVVIVRWKSGAIRLYVAALSVYMYCVDFVENTLFKSSGESCWLPLPSSLLNELSMDKRDSNGFFLRRLACRTNNRSYTFNSTDSSLVTVDYQQSFLVIFLCCLAKLLIGHVHGHAAYYVIAFLWLL